MLFIINVKAAEKFKEPEPVTTAASDAKVESVEAEESDGEEVCLFCYVNFYNNSNLYKLVVTAHAFMLLIIAIKSLIWFELNSCQLLKSFS